VFEDDSRYHDLPDRVFVTPDGREIVYKARRFVPPGATLPTFTHVRVQPAERLDHLTARALGDPTHFWRICDAADALRPSEIDLTPGALVRVPRPQGKGS